MDKDSTFKLDTSMSKAVKGMAIILMVTHHCFGFPAWNIAGIDYRNIIILGVPLWSWVMFPTEICVSVFAFLTGWAYFYNKTPTLKYSVKKIIGFLKYYWFILFLIFIPIAWVLGTYVPTINTILLNMFALKKNLISFAWYVYFYIFAMLLLPFVTKAFRGRWWFDFFFALAFCVVCYNLAAIVPLSRPYLTSGLMQCFYWFPCILAGYLCAKYELFSRLKNILKTSNKLLYLCLMLAAMACRWKWQMLFNVNLDIIYASVFVFSFVMLFRKEESNAKKIFCYLGTHAMNIWFLHSIFFTSFLAIYFQKFAYLPKFPPLVVIWVILLCLPVSIAVNFIFKQQENLFENIKKKHVPVPK